MKPVSPSSLFFFFGSLRQGYWNNGILSQDAVFLGPARTIDPFQLYIGRNGHVPTCIPNVGTTPLMGELYALDPRDASNVYRLETGYDHATFKVTRLDTGDIVDATIFHHKDPLACYYLGGQPVLIPSGDYTDAITPEGRQQAGA